MSMPMPVYYTAEMVRARPDDGKRYETVHGEMLVSPAPRMAHQAVVRDMMFALGNYLTRDHRAGLFTSPSDISWGPDTLVRPDLFVADHDEVTRANGWADVRTLHLAIEVLSPSSLRADRFTKRRLYQEQHVPAYWVVDVDHRLVEVWTPGATFPVVEHERLAWRYSALEIDGTIELAELFGRI